MAMAPITLDELRARRTTVAADLAARGLAGAVVSDPANVRYLTGLALEQPWQSRTRPTACLLEGDGRIVVVTSEAVELDDPPVDAVLRYTRPDEAAGAVSKAIAAAGLDGEPLGAELGGEHRIGMAVDELRAVEDAHGRRFADAGLALWAARLIKSDAELDRLRAASAVGDRVFHRLFAGEIRAGQTEREIARRTRTLMMEEGADEPGWVMITSGAGSYHRLLATPRDRRVAAGEMVWLDIACRVDGYWSDHSRAGVLGAPSADQAAEQERVAEVTRRGVDLISPGVTLGAVARAATLPGEASPGRVGHGLGLGTTEPPDVVASSELVLVPGMVFTVEPLATREHGIYQAETVVAVTAHDHEVLTHAPTSLTALD
jgi:Xaa-Pro aminopeptidase